MYLPRRADLRGSDMELKRKAADHKHPCAKCAVCGLCLSCRLCVCLPKQKAYRPSKAQVEAAWRPSKRACQEAWLALWGFLSTPVVPRVPRVTDPKLIEKMRRALIAADKVRREETEKEQNNA